jgi:hypothetical protein
MNVECNMLQIGLIYRRMTKKYDQRTKRMSMPTAAKKKATPEDTLKL